MEKQTSTAYLLLILLGGFGAHRFYLGKTGSAIAFMLTLGGFGIWWVIDLCTLSEQVRQYNMMQAKAS